MNRRQLFAHLAAGGAWVAGEIWVAGARKIFLPPTGSYSEHGWSRQINLGVQEDFSWLVELQFRSCANRPAGKGWQKVRGPA